MKSWLKKTSFAFAALSLLALPSAAFADSEHKVAQSAPIALGTSGSTQDYIWVGNVAYCFAGTLGGLVEDANGTPYILSNNHVLAQTNAMSIGEPIIHPGSLDAGCSNSGTATVASLSDFVTIEFCQPFRAILMRCKNNTVDAAIARVVDGAVLLSGSIIDVGMPGTTSVVPTIGMPVQKSGRTTGHTTGNIAAVNVDVLVCYADPCNEPNNIARFISQFRVDGAFSGPGDSGSLILECADDNELTCAIAPAAVGLLFAGGQSTTFGNTAGAVFSALNVAMVNCAVDCFGQSTDTNTKGNNGKGGGKKKNAQSSGLAPGLEIAGAVQARHADSLISLPGVLGTGIGLDDDGNPVIEVYVKGAVADAGRPIPSELDGISTHVVVTGQIRAF